MIEELKYLDAELKWAGGSLGLRLGSHLSRRSDSIDDLRNRREGGKILSVVLRKQHILTGAAFINTQRLLQLLLSDCATIESHFHFVCLATA